MCMQLPVCEEACTQAEGKTQACCNASCLAYAPQGLAEGPQSAGNSPTHVWHLFAFLFPNTYARSTYCVHVLSQKGQTAGRKIQAFRSEVTCLGSVAANFMSS